MRRSRSLKDEMMFLYGFTRFLAIFSVLVAVASVLVTPVAYAQSQTERPSVEAVRKLIEVTDVTSQMKTMIPALNRQIWSLIGSKIDLTE